MGFYQLQKKQIIPSSIDIVWDFISTPQNLKLITPPGMGFDIKSENLPNKIYAGMIIEYTVRPLLGIPTTWVTEISQLVERKYFIASKKEVVKDINNYLENSVKNIIDSSTEKRIFSNKLDTNLLKQNIKKEVLKALKFDLMPAKDKEKIKKYDEQKLQNESQFQIKRIRCRYT